MFWKVFPKSYTIPTMDNLENEKSEHIACARVRSVLAKGDFALAFDLAQEALLPETFDADLAYLALLSLARCGAPQQALAEFCKIQPQMPETEQTYCLEARLYKDLFVQGPPESALDYAQKARSCYLKAYRLNHSYYPGINAATLSLLIGRDSSSRSLAEEVLASCAEKWRTAEGDEYYCQVTQAEAWLLLGDIAEAQTLLRDAKLLGGGDFGKLSTTYKQLSLIQEKLEFSKDVIASIRPPTVITYTGQMVHGLGKSAGIDPDDELLLLDHIRSQLQAQEVHIAYGSLACGADLMIAECVLEVGGELNVVLPFNAEEFKRISVASGGAGWSERFDRVLERATTVWYIVEDVGTGYDLLFEACATQSMGLACLRARALGSETYQLALWNGQDSGSRAGTKAAMDKWEQLGFENLVIDTPAPRAQGNCASVEIEETIALKREMNCMIFADVKGFSRLSERDLPRFEKFWLTRLKSLLTDNTKNILYMNTWGDAVFLVLKDIAVAADMALQLADAFSEEVVAAQELPTSLGIRVAAHVGPIFKMVNPLTGESEFFGTHVNQAARLEPCTPVNSVYVTEPFAARLAMEALGPYHCEYVGTHPLPKNFGKISMYHLRRTHAC
jgi:class 3 adenylate cyclase